MAKHVKNTCGEKITESARQAQAGFLQGSIISILLPGASIHSRTGVGLTGGGKRLTTSAMRLSNAGQRLSERRI
jgi:hypothetical protein